MQILFYRKNVHKKLIFRHNMQPNPLTRREYKGKIYVKNIFKKSCRIRGGDLDTYSDQKQIIPDPQHWIRIRVANLRLPIWELGKPKRPRKKIKKGEC